MSVINPNETARTWQAQRPEAAVPLFLAEAAGDVGSMAGSRVAGFPIALRLTEVGAAVPAEEVAAAPVAVIQVQDRPESVERFAELAKIGVPLVAAAFDPPLKLVRELILAGAHDVIPLPLSRDELERSLKPLRQRIDTRQEADASANAKVVTVLKSVGGAGATSLLTQTAIRFAEDGQASGRTACLIDLDVQFGDAAFQLGLRPRLSLQDLVQAGARLDPDLLRATISDHPSGLKVIAAPAEMLPLESFSADTVLNIVELAAREFGTVFVDLPTNWTNWSLSLVARSDLVLLVTEETVSCLHRARRQLELLRSQELGVLDVRVVVNRIEKKLLKSVRLSDVQQALGRDVAFTVANDHPTMRAAIDRGVPLAEIARNSALARDIGAMAQRIAAALGLES